MGHWRASGSLTSSPGVSAKMRLIISWLPMSMSASSYTVPPIVGARAVEPRYTVISSRRPVHVRARGQSGWCYGVALLRRLTLVPNQPSARYQGGRKASGACVRRRDGDGEASEAGQHTDGFEDEHFVERTAWSREKQSRRSDALREAWNGDGEGKDCNVLTVFT